MNQKLIEALDAILPSIIWPSDTQKEHLQLSRILIAVAEQLDVDQQQHFANQMVDTTITSAQIADWLSNQIPQITLILREIIEKNTIAAGELST